MLHNFHEYKWLIEGSRFNLDAQEYVYIYSHINVVKIIFLKEAQLKK
jgi:hypothetical protein